MILKFYVPSFMIQIQWCNTFFLSRFSLRVVSHLKRCKELLLYGTEKGGVHYATQKCKEIEIENK
jgi:hypothetical protein